MTKTAERTIDSAALDASNEAYSLDSNAGALRLVLSNSYAGAIYIIMALCTLASVAPAFAISFIIGGQTESLSLQSLGFFIPTSILILLSISSILASIIAINKKNELLRARALNFHEHLKKPKNHVKIYACVHIPLLCASALSLIPVMLSLNHISEVLILLAVTEIGICIISTCLAIFIIGKKSILLPGDKAQIGMTLSCLEKLVYSMKCLQLAEPLKDIQNSLREIYTKPKDNSKYTPDKNLHHIKTRFENVQDPQQKEYLMSLYEEINDITKKFTQYHNEACVKSIIEIIDHLREPDKATRIKNNLSTFEKNTAKKDPNVNVTNPLTSAPYPNSKRKFLSLG